MSAASGSESSVQPAAPRSVLRVGVMQGRLSPRPAGKLQEFPRASYAAEFPKAARLGLDSIEWIFEAPDFADNPLWKPSGRAEIGELISQSGVKVQSVCADYFMVHRLAGDGDRAVGRNCEVLCELILAAREIGADRILLPLLESSAVDSSELKAEVIGSLRSVAPVAEHHGVTLGLEMEIPGAEYARLIADVGSSHVRAYYDTGNSTAQGLDIGEDIVPLLPFVHAVHIKDRVVGGGSKPLGTGDANFPRFFSRLLGAGFHGDFVLQHYFDEQPELDAERSLSFVQHLIEAARAEAA